MDASPAGLKARVERWIAERADDDVLRWLFGAVLAIAIVVVGLDYAQLVSTGVQAGVTTAAPSALPDASPGVPLPDRNGDKGRRSPLQKPDAQLQARMTFDLQADGRLLATGAIQPGTAQDFAAEVAKRGGYVKSVALHSPGGSLADALTMGRLIREKGFATEVESGRYCASACPLVFAGGVERRAGPKAAIGVHRAVAMSNVPGSSADGMEEGQRVSATCQKYLREMGVDLGVWVHAMETPKDELYYFKPDELIALKLATAGNAAAPVLAFQPVAAAPPKPIAATRPKR